MPPAHQEQDAGPMSGARSTTVTCAPRCMSSVAVARPATPAPMTVTRKALAPERMEVVYRAVAGAHRKAVRRGEGALQIAVRVAHRGFALAALRSEEHTSELQS